MGTHIDTILDLMSPALMPLAGEFLPYGILIGYTLIPILLGLFFLGREWRTVQALERREVPSSRYGGNSWGLLMMFWPLLLGPLVWWYLPGQFPPAGTVFSPFTSSIPALNTVTLLLAAIPLPVAIFFLTRRSTRFGYCMRMGMDAGLRHQPDRVDLWQHRLFPFATGSAPLITVGSISLGWSLGWSYLAAFAGFFIVLIALAVMTTTGTTKIPEQKLVPEQPPTWLQNTPLESDLLRIIHSTGRTRVKAVTIRHTFLSDSIPPGDKEGWRRWFVRQYSPFLQSFLPGSPAIMVAALRVMPPHSLLAALSGRVLGLRRTRIRLGILRVPLLRYMVYLWDLIPAGVVFGAFFIAFYGVMFGSQFLLGGLAMPYALTMGIGLLLTTMLLLNSKTRHSVTHGFAGWKLISPNAATLSNRELVVEYLNHLAVHDAIVLDSRRPEFVPPLLLCNRSVQRLLRQHGLTPQDIPHQAMIEKITEALEDFAAEADRNGCRQDHVQV